MLRSGNIRSILRNSALGIVGFSLLTSCGAGKVDEETFSLYINDKNFKELVYSLQSYSKIEHYNVTMEKLAGASPEATSNHIMLEGGGVRILIQSALAEQCKEREGRRDVEYSHRVFDVNAFSTSYFQSKSRLSAQVSKLKDSLIKYGFRVVSRSESCHLL